MKNTSDRWLKAALLGSVWASIEIVLGSFLHNIRFPLTGTILASIGVAVLVAGHSVWTERGIIWRAGAVCAVMKSISPSAVILGPMVGIMTEALILEAAVRIGRRSLISLFLGGAIALLTPLLQYITTMIITYGFNVARLYASLYNLAARTLHVQSFGAIDLVILLLSINFLIGISAALVGIAVGRRAQTIQPINATHPSGNEIIFPFADVSNSQKFFPPFLMIHGVAIAGGLALFSLAPMAVATAFLCLYALFVITRYRRIIKRIQRPRLWIEFAVISLLAGVVFGGINNHGDFWSWFGLVIGIEMILRATLMILAFTSISVELRNPAIVQWFLNRGMGNFSEALNTAFAALPVMVRALGEEKQFFRHPINSLARIIAAAEGEFARYQSHHPSVVMMLIGPMGSGKSSLVQSIAARLKKDGYAVGGISQPVIWKENQRIGYDILDLNTLEQQPLCRLDSPDIGVSAGPYRFIASGLEFGKMVLSSNCNKKLSVFFIDEIGPLELDGKGWADMLREVLRRIRVPLIITARPWIIDEIKTKWQISPTEIWDLETTRPETISEYILNATINAQ